MVEPHCVYIPTLSLDVLFRGSSHQSRLSPTEDNSFGEPMCTFPFVRYLHSQYTKPPAIAMCSTMVLSLTKLVSNGLQRRRCPLAADICIWTRGTRDRTRGTKDLPIWRVCHQLMAPFGMRFDFPVLGFADRCRQVRPLIKSLP